ncbi:hypothetical protein KFL_001020130 [Klebsormidium nitens]|uniref:Rhodanese domain-containing protein n=1 Tax=Klebsormidium nitens TaxID=105231 RepID=A0A1Y1HVH1_KLENI|nr:hypothetical protein KFL_001020130 [Klebsormidium nitens]|eukprot:GAQ82163.1 hypothetical protein KFL_001020130 [Klebsormidium nitens]
MSSKSLHFKNRCLISHKPSVKPSVKLTRFRQQQRVGTKIRASSSNQQVQEEKKESADEGEEPVFNFDTSPQGRDRGVFGKWVYDNFMAKQTKEYKLAQMVEYQKAGNTKVRTWLGEEFAYTSWIEVFRSLKKSGLKQVEATEAHELASQGKAVLIDVAESQDYARIHAAGAASAPLFRLIQGSDFKSNLRRLGYAMITDFAGTERNPEFAAKALAAASGDKSKPLIVYCQIGGDLETEVVVRSGKKEKRYKDPERTFGRQSRSLKAVYELQQAGFTNIRHMKGGLSQWSHIGLPLEASE